MVGSLVGVAGHVMPALSCIIIFGCMKLPWVVQRARHHDRQPLAVHDMGRA